MLPIAASLFVSDPSSCPKSLQLFGMMLAHFRLIAEFGGAGELARKFICGSGGAG
jgi:hypothetical protein